MGRSSRLFIALAASAVLVFFGAAAAHADAPSGWTYSYSALISGEWTYTQNANIACRHWPAPGYSTSSTYYRLGNSLDSTFKARSRTAADVWSAVDPMFHFYELPLGSAPYDHTVGMNPDIQYPGVNVLDQRWDYANNRPYLHNWYIRYRTSLSAFGFYWIEGAYPYGIDILSVATHEFGHALVLEDVQGSWSDSTRPTMYGQAIHNTIYGRTLAYGDIIGASTLY